MVNMDQAMVAGIVIQIYVKKTENTIDSGDGRCFIYHGNVTKLFGDQTRNSVIYLFSKGFQKI